VSPAGRGPHEGNQQEVRGLRKNFTTVTCEDEEKKISGDVSKGEGQGAK